MAHDEVFAEAMASFRRCYEEAQELGLREPAAAALATADAAAAPSVRIVLVREFDERGFVFYTNSLSRKGLELAANPRAALCFYWDGLAQQVRVEGEVEQASERECEAYWNKRPRDRQLGAWVSDQSERLESPELLMQLYAEFDQRFAGVDVPRPDHWFGYRVIPRRLEFWSSRPARLHERVVFECQSGGWQKYLLFP
jgi:pyridoxamine 5'-phosphate oxidase